MVRTGGTLSAKMIELIGSLNEDKTMKDITKSMSNIEKKLRDSNNRIKLNVELFGNVKEMAKDITQIQAKLSEGKKVKLGVELGEINVQDMNAQIKAISDKFKQSKTGTDMKLEIDFDFKGSASKIKKEMEGIKQFMQTYGKQMSDMEVVNLDGSAKNVKKNSDGIKSDVKVIGSDMKKMSDGIESEMKSMTKSSGDFSVNFKRDMTGAISGADAQIKSVDGTVQKFKYTVDDTGKAFKIQAQSTKMAGDQQLILADATKKADDAQRQLNTAVKNAPQGINKELIERAQAQINVTREMVSSNKVTEEGVGAMNKFKGALSELNTESGRLEIEQKFKEMKVATSQAIDEFEKLGRSKEDVARFRKEMESMTVGSEKGMKQLQASVKSATEEAVRDLQQMEGAFKKVNEQDFGKAIKDGDILKLKQYVEEMKGASVASLRLTEAKDKEGNAINKVKVNMEAQKGVVKSSTIEYNNATGKIYELDKSTKTLSETNKGLDGSFAGILKRITQYFGAMQVLQKGMQAFKAVIGEIQEIDAQMTELARVADPSLNLEHLLSRSVDLSKELGASVSDVVGVVGDMARTFGEFNEEQLLAITRTATIMQNVSELSLEQASSTLVGTMKAFNIEAEDTLHIVNAYNEVDNNFAISTDQIANAMSRAGATAQTFGVDMEHLIGDITAVGETTQESGERIGTALRTIYSRVTTHDKAVESLQTLGIAMHEMGDSGPQLRDASDILGDLGGKWADLTAEQQQNTALNIAGRNRMTQFLALMNNYQTAVDATTTAYNSQGSAMLEQQAYMQSYEYRMKVLGATTTELALTMERKFVGDALYAVVDVSIVLIESLDWLIDKVGVLPAVFGLATTAVLLFSKSARAMSLVPVGDMIVKLLANATQFNNVIGTMTTKLSGAVGGLTKWGSIFTGGVVIAGVMAVAMAVEFFVKKIVASRKATEEAEQSLKDGLEVYNRHGNNIDGLVDRYDELNKALQMDGELNLEDEREYRDLVTEISTAIPSAISHIDAKGEAHLRSTESIRKELTVMDELAEANAKIVAEMAGDEVAERAKRFSEAMKKNESSTTKVEFAQKQLNRTYQEYSDSQDAMTMAYGGSNRKLSEAEFETRNLDGTTKDYVKSASVMNATAFEMHQILQEQTLSVGDSTIAMMTSEGAMENVSNSAQALIRNYSSLNTEIITSYDDFEEGTQALQNSSLEFGKIVSGVYDNISQGMDEVSAEKAITQFDMLVNALPDDAFQQPISKIQSDFKALEGVIGEVSSNSDLNVKQLVKSLTDSGVDINTAKTIVKNLGIEFENNAIKIAIADDELTVFNDELVRTQKEAIGAIKPLEELFGFDTDIFSNMDDYIQVLDVLRSTHGDAWGEVGKGAKEIQELADFFGVSTGIVKDNYDELKQYVLGINDASIAMGENGNYYLEFSDDVSKSTQEMLRGMLNVGDGTFQLTDEILASFGVYEQGSDKVSKSVKRTEDDFKQLLAFPWDDNKIEVLLEGISEELEDVRGSVAFTGEGIEDFKLIMADGTDSPYFEMLQKNFEGTGYWIEATEVENGKMQVSLRNETDNTIRKLGEFNNMALDGTYAIEKQEEALRALKNESTSDEDRETFLTVLNNQVDAFGDGIVVTSEKGKDLKLEFEDGTTSPWLESMMKLVNELGFDIEVAGEGTDDFKLIIKDDEGNSIFDSEQQKVKDLGKDIDETKEKVDGLAGSDVVVDVDVDTTKVDEAVPHVNSQMDVIMQGKNVVMIDADGTPLETTVDGAKEKIDEIKKNEVELKVKPGDITEFNDVIEKITGAKIEMQTVEDALDALHKNLIVTNENMQGLMTNTENINNAHSAVKKLIEIIDISIQKMGELYQAFSSGGIDVSGFENASAKITEEANAIESALKRIQDYVGSMNLSIRNMDASFDITPITSYRETVLSSAHLIASDITALAVVVATQMKKVSDAFQQGNVSLAQVQIVTSNILGQVVILHRLTGEMITSYSLKASSDMLNNYNKGLVGILGVTTTFKSLMDNHFKQFYTSMVQKVTLTANDMRSKFLEGTNGMVTIAEGLPGRIGRGVRDNMSQASSSMTALARDMVKRFKSELGIHSPSRVFTGLGGDIIDGLVNGLSGSDISNLGQSVFSDFSDGAISTINEIKGYMTFEPVTAGSFGAGFSKTSGFGLRSSPGGIGSTNHKGVDYGAPSGTPIPSQSSGTVIASGYNGSMGNYVRVRSGDGKVHTYMHNSRNNVGVGQTIGRGQILGLVGSTGNSTGPHVHYQIDVNGRPIDPEKKFRGFAEGGFVDKKELAWHGEEGLEAIIPLIPQRRERGLDLWQETGEILGMNSELLSMLIGTKRKSSEYGGSSGFAGMDGEAGSGSSDTATSGTMKPDYSSVMRSLGIEHEPMFTSMANNYKREDEKPEALYRRDYASIRTSMHEDMVTKANIELKALTEQTLAYRNALVLVSKQENQLKRDTESRLKSTVKRQKAIEKELGTLRNTSKHTVKQRKRYNELQEEYDKNTESIMSMENSIRNLHIAMDERKVEIYIDYFKQLSKQYDTATESLGRVMARSQYYLDRVSLEDENDIVKQQSWRNDVIKQTIRLEKTLLSQQRLLGEEYDKAKKKYGSQSEQALFARSELIRVEDAYRGTVLERIKKEQESEKIRKDIADNGIKALKDYYSQTQAITEKAIELERKVLEKAHQEKMDRYDEEISKIESVYDAQLKEMDESKAEEEYQGQISALNEQRSELMLDISRASRDTSLEGRKRLAELQSELSDVNGEIQSTQKERQEELYRTAIENQKQAQIDSIEAEREAEEKKAEIRMEQLDKQAEDAKKYAESMINDNAFWERLSNQFVAGDTNELNALMEEMQFRMADFASGDFTGVSMGYDKLSDEDKQSLQDDVLLDISNSILESNDDIKKYISASNVAIERVTGDGYKYGKTQETGGGSPSISTQAQSEPTLPKPKPKPKPVQNNRYHTIKRGDTLWDLAQKFYGNPYKWTTIAQANKSPDPYKLQVGSRLLVPFKTGGYTGDWMGDEGRVAMLHKKELVLNESQTGDILNVAKIVESIAGIIPKMQVNRPKLSTSSSSSQGDTYVIDNLNLNMKDFKGSRDDAKRAFDNMAKELKKRGKK